MTSIILRSNEVIHALSLFLILVLVHKSDGYEFVVGGQKGWSVPNDPNSNPYNEWAENSRFQIGDSLVFNYPSGQDSVLQVNSKDFGNCNTNVYSKKFSDGHTIIKLDQSGAHYFISGNKNNCLKNEKLVVVVLAERSNKNSNTNQTITTDSPSPSPLPSVSQEPLAPTTAPTQQVLPSPPVGAVGTSPPYQQQAPSPTTGTVLTNPTPAPISEPPPPPNAASSILLSFVSSVGAFMASALVLSF
ncbi:unnamed protein product [Lupinus luteus]|uniref:Phytocyanin domain-containing protein n=1 Tax=Lupinus luteus TaxID=3873 RepID=A0AAV1XPC0_LUPLU